MDRLNDDDPCAPSFDEFVRDGISLIPAFAPQWTNHNPSDPGVTLVELLAYFSEILAYRALRVTPDAKLYFLRLLEEDEEASTSDGLRKPSDGLHGKPSATIEEAIRERVRVLSQTHCAVTPRDFEQLAVDAASTSGTPTVMRAFCVPGIDLQHAGSAGLLAVEAPADVSIILAPETELPDDELQQTCVHVQQELAPRCLLTTRVHVVGPAYLYVFVACRIALEPGVSLSEAMETIDSALRLRFGPVSSNEQPANARDFGRPLHLPEVYGIIDRCLGVDYVENIIVRRMATHDADDRVGSLVGIQIGVISRLGEDSRLGGLASVGTRRLIRDPGGEVEAVWLRPWELARVQLARDAIQEIHDGDGAAGPGGRHAP